MGRPRRERGGGRPTGGSAVERPEAVISVTRPPPVVALPAKLQNDLKQFQRVQQDLQSAAQQRMQFDMKLREAVHTLDELKTLPDDTSIYRPIGGLLVKAKGKSEVEELLTEEKETLEVRLKALERQEGHLKEKYTQMQKELTEALDKAGVVDASGNET
jgi:prefoldin beta subunit